MTTRVGFIGLGNIGRHLAMCLVRAGHEVTVHDLDREQAAALVQQGARWADSPREVAEAVTTVVTCLPSPQAVRSVMTGPTGAVDAMTAGSTWIEMSTNDREEVRQLAALLAERGADTLEAPVTGGVHKAAKGEMTVLVAGAQDVYEQHIDIFKAVGNNVFYMGPLGNASVIKVITNMLAFIHLVAAGEALMLAKRAGLDMRTSFEAIRASSGNSFVHETESQVILSGSYNIGFTMDLACKDLAFAGQLGRDFGVPLALEGLVERTFQQARAQYGGDAWSPMVVKLLEDAVGDELRASGFPQTLTDA